MSHVIKVGFLYWRDYTSGDWPWTSQIDLAARFDQAVAEKIIAYWTTVHHPEILRPDGSVLSPATRLGSILPLDAQVVSHK